LFITSAGTIGRLQYQYFSRNILCTTVYHNKVYSFRLLGTLLPIV